MASRTAAAAGDTRPFYESPLNIAERFGRLQLLASPDGDLRLKKSEDYTEALEQTKTDLRTKWSHSRLNRGILFTGYPGVITVKVERGANDWETWKNILRAENDWVEKQYAARVKRKEEPEILENDPKRQRTMTSNPHSALTRLPWEVVVSPGKVLSGDEFPTSQAMSSQAISLLHCSLHVQLLLASRCLFSRPMSVH